MFPALPRLMTALESSADTMLAPERIVELETAGWPFTVTLPETVISPAVFVGTASATVEYTHHIAATVINVMNLRNLFLPSIWLNILLNQSFQLEFNFRIVEKNRY